MFPGVSPGAVGKHIANGVAGDGIGSPGNQEIFPAGIGVIIVECVLDLTQGFRRVFVVVLLLCLDIAGVVVLPGPGLIICLVIFPDQLILAVVV